MSTEHTTELTIDQAEEIRYTVIKYIQGIKYLYKPQVDLIIDAICKRCTIKRTPMVETIITTTLEEYFSN